MKNLVEFIENNHKAFVLYCTNSFVYPQSVEVYQSVFPGTTEKEALTLFEEATKF